MAIVLLALIALWALGTGWAYVSRSAGEAPRPLLPLPNQVKAIVDMLEASPDRRDVVLAAVNSDTLVVTVSAQAPAVPPGVRRWLGIEWLVERYVNVLGKRDVIAVVDPPEHGWWRQVRLGQYGLYVRQPLRLAVPLDTGGYAVFETRGDIARRLFGLPPGFWMGALGSLIGIAAILAIVREARPLRELSRAVTRFGAEASPVPVRPSGAPEIRKLIAAVNDMQARIATLVKGRTVLVAGLSHDLKTYITRLRLRAEMIPDDAQRERATHDLDEMTQLIDDTLIAVREARRTSSLEAIDLAQLIEAETAERPTGAIEIVRVAGLPQVLVNGNPLTLRRLFTNLIDNSMRFGKTCRVTVAGNGAMATVLVDDDGPGVPQAERLRVFEPFYRLEPSRNRATGGSGLGLAIARQIVDAHGGSIVLETSPANGARVRVELPMIKHNETMMAGLST